MLFIRHSVKEYTNGKSTAYPLDPDLTEKGVVLAHDKFALLVEKYGVPNKIVTSPYLRTRRTAEIAQQVIYDTKGIVVDIVCDNYLSEYLNYDKYHNIKLEEALKPETLEYNPMLPETRAQHKKRMYDVVSNYTPNVWLITHGFNVYTIALLKGYNIKHPKEMCGIIISDDGTIIQI